MCDPVSAIAALSLGAQVGGQVMQRNEAVSNQAAAITAKNKAAGDTIAKEQALQKQSSGIFDQTLAPFQGSTAPNLQPAQAANTSALTANAPTAGSLAAGATTGNAPKVVQDSENSAIGARMAKLHDSDVALGNLTGYDSANAATSRNFAGAKDQIGTVGNFAQENANVGAAQMEADVANSQKAPSPWGDLLQGAGTIGSYYAGQNGAFNNLFKGASKVPKVTSI